MAENGASTRAVTLRKWVHLAGGLMALIPWTRPIALMVTGIGAMFNATVLQGWPFFRDLRRGPRDVGFITYPAALFVAFGLFGAEIGRGAWVELAVGDWAATYFGMKLGGPTVPWNRRKHWWGALAHALLGFVAVWLFSVLVLHASWDAGRLAGILAICALVETLVSEGWDNLLVVVSFSGLARLVFGPRP